MANLNQVVVIFHSLIIPAEQMAQRKAVILLSIESLIFNFPASATVKGRFLRVSAAQRQIRQENKRVGLAVFGVFQTVELMAFIVNAADEIIAVRYFSVSPFSPVYAQFA